MLASAGLGLSVDLWTDLRNAQIMHDANQVQYTEL
jgi:hypothetical protein